MQEPSVTQDDIVRGLREVGLRPGDVAFIHSSLSAFGHVEGGAETVVRALLEALGDEGTLVAPIFRHYFTRGPDQVWDRDRSPSLVGRISETVRTWPGAMRSHHAPHPIAAIGPLAADLTERRNESDFAVNSPFARLIELDAWIVLLGVGYNVCTLAHLLEERTEIPYRHWVWRTGVVVEDGVSTRKSYPFFETYPDVHNDFDPLGERLERRGKVRECTIGRSRIRAFCARDLYDIGLAALREDPFFLVSNASREVAQRHARPFGKLLDEQATQSPPRFMPANSTARRLAERLNVPGPRGRITAEVRNRWEARDGLVLEELRLLNGPHEVLPGILAMPKTRNGRLPAVLCLHSTGGTCERTMEEPFVARGAYLSGWARELARRGFVTFAITQFSNPPRPEPWNWEWPRLLPAYGQTAMGRLVADAICANEYLRGRKEVDPERIGVSGFSLGGIVAFYAFAVDARMGACAVFCGGVGSVRRLIREGVTSYHSVYYYVPGLLSENLDHPQLLPALAPRPLWVYGATEDVGMPVAGLREFESAAQAVYAQAGASDAVQVVIGSGPHAMTMAAFDGAAAWLADVLSVTPV